MHEPGGLVRVTYVKSAIGYARRQKETVRSLGLRRLGDSSILPDNPAVRGMIRAVQHLVAFEPMADAIPSPATERGGTADEPA